MVDKIKLEKILSNSREKRFLEIDRRDFKSHIVDSLVTNPVFKMPIEENYDKYTLAVHDLFEFTMNVKGRKNLIYTESLTAEVREEQDEDLPLSVEYLLLKTNLIGEIVITVDDFLSRDEAVFDNLYQYIIISDSEPTK